MYKRKPAIIINDMIQSVDHILMYTAPHTYKSFSTHFMTIEACIYNLQIIGEAVSQLPDEFKKSYPDVPWTLIKGMRNRLIHEYFGTDLELVWNVIKEELPRLSTALKNIQATLKKD